MVQGPWGPYAAMQLLAAMQLRGSGTGPGQATACLRMGPMGPGALDHGPYGPQGPWAQPLFDCVDAYFFFVGILGVPNNNA